MTSKTVQRHSPPPLGSSETIARFYSPARTSYVIRALTNEHAAPPFRIRDVSIRWRHRRRRLGSTRDVAARPGEPRGSGSVTSALGPRKITKEEDCDGEKQEEERATTGLKSHCRAAAAIPPSADAATPLPDLESLAPSSFFSQYPPTRSGVERARCVRTRLFVPLFQFGRPGFSPPAEARVRSFWVRWSPPGFCFCPAGVSLRRRRVSARGVVAAAVVGLGAVSWRSRQNFGRN